MKKLIALLLLAAMISVSAIGCGGSDTTSKKTTGATTASSSTKTP